MKAYDGYFTSLPLSRDETLFHIYKKLENKSFLLTKFTGKCRKLLFLLGHWNFSPFENREFENKAGPRCRFFSKILKQLANSQ